MVRYNDIIKVIEDYVAKCYTLAQMKERLSLIPQDEKDSLLKNLMNDGEKQWYNRLRDNVQWNIRKIEDMTERMKEDTGKQKELDAQFIEEYKDTNASLQELMFQFERRIIEGNNKKHNTPPKFNIDDFKMENQFLDDHTDGAVEDRQVDYQKSTDWTDEDISELRHYFGSGSRSLNSYLNNGRHWNKFSDEEKAHLEGELKERSKNLSKTLRKTKGLVEPTVVFHGGRFDITKEVGDKIKFKGFTSTSFREGIAEGFGEGSVPMPLHYTYKLLLPKGTKGFCGHDSSYPNSRGEPLGYGFEHEYLLDKGFEGDIVDIDYDKHIVTVLGRP